MRKIVLCAGMGFALGMVILAVSRAGSGQEVKDANKGWVDYDDLTETERLKERPGNYQVLGAVSDFFDRMYRIRPDYSQCAYPLQEDSKTFTNQEEADKRLDAGRHKNKLRQYNINIKSLTVYDAGEMDHSAELRKKLGNPRMQDRFLAVRKRHPGRAVVVLLDRELHSLQSKKIEGGGPDDQKVLYLVRSKECWRVAWIDN